MSVFVVGAARTPFGRSELTGREHGVRAARAALADAGIPWSRVGAAFGGSDAAGNASRMQGTTQDITERKRAEEQIQQLALYDSLTTKLAKVPDHAVLFPGHLYSAEPSQSMADTRRWNYVFTPNSKEQWLATFGQ